MSKIITQLKTSKTEEDFIKTAQTFTKATPIKELNQFLSRLPFQENTLELDQIITTLVDSTAKTKTVFKNSLRALRAKAEKRVLDAVQEEGGVVIQRGCNNSKKTFLKMTEQGIFKHIIDVKYNMALLNDPIPQWEWDQFEVTRVLREQIGGECTKRYNFTLNGETYEDKEFLTLRDNILAPQCLIESQYRQLFGRMLHKHIQQSDIPVSDYSSLCGYTKDGWRLPDKYAISAGNGERKKAKHALTTMVNMEVDFDIARLHMKDLYSLNTTENKDYIFAFGLVAPFLHALKDHTDLSPFLALESVGGGTGKTVTGEMVSHKIWNQSDKPVLTSDNIDSPARFGNYISSSTFALVFDDVGKSKDKVQDAVKTSLTGDTRTEKLNKDQSIKQDYQNVASMIFTWNYRPGWFHDPALLSRGVILPVTRQINESDKIKYKNATAKIPNGYIGKYIYSLLATMPIENLIQQYDKRKGMEGDTRANTVHKIFYLGQYLMERLFGITLNLENLEKFINQTRELGGEALHSLIKIQLYEGKLKVRPSKEGTTEGFYPNARWVSSCVYQTVSGDYIYATPNLSDLNKLKGERYRMPELCSMLSRAKGWEGLKVTHARAQTTQESVYGILIPRTVIEGGTKTTFIDYTPYLTLIEAFKTQVKKLTEDNNDPIVMEDITEVITGQITDFYHEMIIKNPAEFELEKTLGKYHKPIGTTFEHVLEHANSP